MTTPAIDYTDKDFASLRAAMLRLASQRLPEWTDRSPGDLVMVLIDLFAYCGDILAYYQDRIASELFLETATERAGVVDLLRLIGYELSPPTPARTDLTLTFHRPVKDDDPRTVTIAHGRQFRAEIPAFGPVVFTYVGADRVIDLTSDDVRPAPAEDEVQYDGLPVEQGERVTPETLGSGSGEPNQILALPSKQVNLDSVVIEVDEGASLVRWHRATPGAPSTDPLAREYRLVVDASQTPRVVFANRPPPVGTNNVHASYRVSLGARGNVVAGAVAEAVDPPADLEKALASVTNPEPASGGSDAESPQSGIRNAPSVFRSLQRAVTAEDFLALTYRTGAVAKVRVRNPSWNRVALYVAPAGDRLTPLSESLRDHLLATFEDKRPLCTTVEVHGARPAPIDISCAVVTDDRSDPGTVVTTVRAAIADLLGYERVDFAQTLYLSDVYAVVEAVPGVVGTTVTRFRRADRGTVDVDAELARSGLPPLGSLPAFIRAAVSAEVESSGRIELGESEIPVLGSLDVRVQP
jgi:uncharacterized phage protein gp47/JayE